MRYFSTFSGVEGIGQGLPQEWGCVGFSEIDKYASMVLKYRFPDVKNHGTITDINWSEVPDFDVLTGGSPCQDFSIAGKRRGLKGNRSSLAWEFIRGLRSKQPNYFIWENVKGVMSSRGGWDFANLLCAFSESGYALWWQVLNAKDFGVAQNRERIFIIGARDGSLKEVFFESKDSGQIDQLNNPEHSNERLYDPAGIAPTLNTMQGGHRQPFVRITEDGFHMARNDEKKSSIQGTHVTFPSGKSHALSTAHVPMTVKPYIVAQRGRNPENPKSRKSGLPTEQMLEARMDGISNTLTSVEKDNYVFDGQVRKLTPKECERLMGWQDDWTRYGINEKGETIEISDSQRYKMCGNGVVSPCIKALVENVITPIN